MNLSQKLSGDVLVTAIMNIAKKFRSFAYIPLIVGALDTSSYGVFTQILVISDISGFVFSLGLNAAFVKLSQDSQRNKSGMYSSLFFSSLISGLMAGIGVAIFSTAISEITLGSEEFAKSFLIGSALIPIRIIFNMGKSYYRSEMRTKLTSTLSTGRHYITLILVAIVLYVNEAIIIEDIILTMVLSELFITVLVQTSVFFQTGFSVPQRDIIEDAFRYSIPFAASNVASNLSSRVDRLIVGSFLGSEAVGIYDIAYRISSVVMTYSQPIDRAFFPEFSRLLQNDDYKACSKYLQKGVRIFIIFSIPSIFGLVLIKSQLVQLIAEEQIIVDVGNLIPVIMLGIVFWGLERLYGVVLVASGHTTRLLYIRGGTAAINIVLNIFLIPIFGIKGAAISTLISYVISSYLTYINTNKIVESKLDLVIIIKSVLCSSVMYISVLYLGLENLLVILIISPIVYFGMMVLTKGINYRRLIAIYS